MALDMSMAGTTYDNIRTQTVHYDDLDGIYAYFDNVINYLLVSELDQETRPELTEFIGNLGVFADRIWDEIIDGINDRIVAYEKDKAEQAKMEQELAEMEERLAQKRASINERFIAPAKSVVKSDEEEEDQFALPVTTVAESKPAIESMFDFNDDDLSEMLVDVGDGLEDDEYGPKEIGDDEEDEDITNDSMLLGNVQDFLDDTGNALGPDDDIFNLDNGDTFDDLDEDDPFGDYGSGDSQGFDPYDDGGEYVYDDDDDEYDDGYDDRRGGGRGGRGYDNRRDDYDDDYDRGDRRGGYDDYDRGGRRDGYDDRYDDGYDDEYDDEYGDDAFSGEYDDESQSQGRKSSSDLDDDFDDFFDEDNFGSLDALLGSSNMSI